MNNKALKPIERPVLQNLTRHTITLIGGPKDLAKHRIKQAIKLEKEARASHERWMTKRSKAIKMVEEQASVLMFTDEERAVAAALRLRMLKKVFVDGYGLPTLRQEKLTLKQKVSNWIAKLWKSANF